MPRAAPPDKASPIFGGDEVIVLIMKIWFILCSLDTITGFAGLTRSNLRSHSTSQSRHAHGRCRERRPCLILFSPLSNSVLSHRVPVRAQARCVPGNEPESERCKHPGNSPQSPSD